MIGKKIRELRLQRGMTQAELGKRCGIAETTIRRYELGGLNPKYETVCKIATALGVKAGYFYPQSELNTVMADTKIYTDKTVKEMEYIKDRLGDTEILAQLAEECAELGQAALKLRRVLDGKNPTPKTPEEAKADLVEEIADVMGCLTLIGMLDDADIDEAQRIMMRKYARWAERLRVVLEEREAEENERIHED